MKNTKLTAALLAAALTVFLAGCGSAASSATSAEPESTAASTEVAEPTAEPTPEPTPEPEEDNELYLASETTMYDDFFGGKVEYFYDENGNLVKKIETTDEEGSGTVTEWTVDENGNILSERQAERFGGDGEYEETSYEEYTYDDAGRKVSSEGNWSGGISFTRGYTYDDAGRLVEETFQRSDDDTPTVTTYTYQDGYDLPLTEEEDNGYAITTITRDFDTLADKGEYIQVRTDTIWPDAKKEGHYRLSDNQVTYYLDVFQNTTNEQTTEYDENGNKSHVYGSNAGRDFDYTYENTYDEAGNLVQADCISKGSVSSTITYEYKPLREVQNTAE